MKAKTIFDDLQEIANEGAASRGHGLSSMAAGYMLAEQLRKTLIRHRESINSLDENGMSPLMKLIEIGMSSQFIALAIELGADVTIFDNQQRTALHLAANKLNEDYITVLLKAGANPLAEDENGETPAHIAAKNHYGGNIGHDGEININLVPFTRCKEFAEYQDDEGNTLLHLVLIHARNDDCAPIKAYQNHPHLLSVKNIQNKTPLEIAIETENQTFLDDLLESLVCSGKFENIKDLCDQFPQLKPTEKLAKRLLFVVTKHGSISMLRSLVEDCQFSLECTGYESTSLLLCAIEFDREEQMDYLISKDKSLLHRRNCSGLDPVLMAAKHGRLKILQKLVEEYKLPLDIIDIDPEDMEKYTGKRDMSFQELLEFNKRDDHDKKYSRYWWEDYRSSHGYSTLDISGEGNLETFLWVLDNITPISVDDMARYIHSPIFFAIWRGKLDILKACLKNDALKAQFNKFKSDYIEMCSDSPEVLQVLHKHGLIQDFQQIIENSSGNRENTKTYCWLAHTAPDLIVKYVKKYGVSRSSIFQSVSILEDNDGEAQHNEICVETFKAIIKAFFSVGDFVGALDVLHKSIERFVKSYYNCGIKLEEDVLVDLYKEFADLFVDEIVLQLKKDNLEPAKQIKQYCSDLCATLLTDTSLEMNSGDDESFEEEKVGLDRIELTALMLMKLATGCFVPFKMFRDAQEVFKLISDQSILQKLSADVRVKVKIEIVDARLSGQIEATKQDNHDDIKDLSEGKVRAIKIFGLLGSLGNENQDALIRKQRLDRMLLDEGSDSVSDSNDVESEISTKVLKAFVFYHLKNADFSTVDVVLEKLSVVFDRLEELESSAKDTLRNKLT